MLARGLRSESRRSLAWWVALPAAFVLTASPLCADNGDVAIMSELLQGTDLSDVAFDSSPNPPGGSFWVLGRLTGKIYHLSTNLATSLGEIDNPHGTGSIPNFILSWGLAYRPTTKTLLVLAQDAGRWKIREVDAVTGDEVMSGAFEIQPPNPESAALRGLSYDSYEGELWYLDAISEILVRTNLEGEPTAQFPLPTTAPGETVLRGEGISFEIEAVGGDQFEPRLYVPYGDFFSQDPTRVIQLSPDGNPTGIEVPLQLPCVRGIQTYRFGLQRRIVVVTCEGTVAQIEQVIPEPVPPSEVRCQLSRSNQVEISWKNNGEGGDQAYGGQILVLRNGVAFATLPGETTSFADATPLEGISTYTLRAAATTDGPLSPESFPCTISVGVGGLVGWRPFDGRAIVDIARAESTGDIFVTDGLGVGGKGRIFRYDSDLNLAGEIETIWERSGPIAYVPTIDLDTLEGTVTLEDVLAVGRTDNLLLSLMTLDGEVKMTFPMGLEAEGARAGGLTYIPTTQEFVVLETTEHKVVYLSQNGRQKKACVPSEIFSLPRMVGGLSYDGVRDSLLVTFEDGNVRELSAAGNCLPSGEVQFPLASLGDAYASAGFTGGLQIVDNTLFVVGKASNAIFQVLLFPYTPEFRRGDVIADEQVRLDDAVTIAQYLFLPSSPAPPCPDAADVNDDAVIDVADPVYLLYYLYVSGPEPPAPFPEAGPDPTFRDNLGCGD